MIVDGQPQYDETKLIDEWTTDDLLDYTESYEKSVKFVDRLKNLLGFEDNTSSFMTDFEKKYQDKGNQLVYFTWQTKNGERSANRISSIQAGMTDSVVQLLSLIHI